MTAQYHDGQVTTFYSYKGGTGRSMALANTACLLARQNQGEILMVDWDMEAPGLHRYFPSNVGHSIKKSRKQTKSSKPVDNQLGLIDLMLELDQATPQSRPSTRTDLDARAEKTLTTIDLKSYITPTEVAGLYLLKAGCFDPTYATRVNTFKWEDLYQRSPRLMPMLAQHMAQSYRHVLLDSRTGVADISSICTTLMPEVLVVVFTPNRQSLTGVEEMVQQATDYRRRSGDPRPLLVYPLPSRIDSEREDLRKLWRYGDAKQDIEGYQPLFENLLRKGYELDTCDLDGYFSEVLIPHSSDFSYGEAIAVLSDKGDDRISLSRSYQAFMEWFGETITPWESPAEIRRETELRQRAEEAAAMASSDEVETAIKQLYALLQSKLPPGLWEPIARAMLDIARAAYPKDRFGASALNEQFLTVVAASVKDSEASLFASLLIEAGNLSLEHGDYLLAVRLFERACTKFSESYGESHLLTLKAANQLVEGLLKRGDVSNARSQAEQVVKSYRRLVGEEHPDALASMDTLALTLQNQGDLPGARALQEKVLDIRRRVMGEKHSDTLTSMDNLAGTLLNQGDLSGARDLQERVLEVRRRELGEEHPDTLSSMNNLAETLRTQGDLPGARALQERVLEVRRRVLGEEHPATLSSMNNLAGTLKNQGDLPRTRALQEKVLEARRRVLGEEHPATLISMGNLALTLRSQGDLPGTRTLQEKVREVSHRMLGEEHPDTLTSMNNLASTLWNQGDLTGARILQEKVLELSRRVLGEEHPDTLRSMNNLANTLWNQGDLPGARALQEKVREVSDRVLGEEHPDTLRSMNNLAITLGSQGDLFGARALQEKVREVSHRMLGEEHPDTLTSMNNLASTLWNQGDLPRARVLLEKVLEVSRRVLGPEHPDTLTSMGNLAGTLWSQGDMPGARVLQEKVLEVSRRVLGPEHPDTLDAMRNLGALLKEMGETESAYELMSQAAKPITRTTTDTPDIPAFSRQKVD